MTGEEVVSQHQVEKPFKKIAKLMKKTKNILFYVILYELTLICQKKTKK